MRNGRSALQHLYLPAVTVLILLVPLAAYYFYVSGRMAYFTSRNLRELSVTSDQLRSKVNNFGGVLAKAARQASGKQNGEGFNIEEFIKESVPELTYAGTTEAETSAKCGAPDTTSSLRVRQERNESVLEFNCACDGRNYRAKSSLGDVVDPFVRTGVFSDVLVTEDDGRVIFQHSRSGPRIARADMLLGQDDSQKAQNAWKTLSATGNVADLKIAGSSYKLFVQPVPLELRRGEKPDAESPGWVLCGLVERSKFLKDSMAISYNIIAWFVFGILVIFLSYPFLKVKFMSRLERLRAVDGLFLAFSTASGLSLLTLLSLSAYYDYSLNRQTESQLQRFADAIDENLTGELSDMYDQLTILTTRAGNFIERQPSTLSEERTFFDHHKDPYRYMDLAFWTDEKGKQLKKWGVRKQVTPSIDISTRSYFTNVRDGRFWVSRGKSFQLQPIYSYTTGENTAAMFIRTPGSGALWGAGMTSRLLSLIDPVVPSGFGYAIIDADGLVVFHSDETRNLRENFFDELSDDSELRSAVFGRASKTFSADYRGRGQQFFARPFRGIENLPWSLVAYRDKMQRRSLDLEVLTLTFFLLVLYGAAFTLGFSVLHLLPPKYPLDWVWPDHEKAGAYRHLIAVYLVIAGISAVWIFRSGASQILYWVLFVPAYATVLAFVRLMPEDADPGWKAPAGKVTLIVLPVALGALAAGFSPEFQWWTPAACAGFIAAGWSVNWGRIRKVFDSNAATGCRAAYLWGATVLLVVIGTLPCAALFKISHDHEMELLVKHGQLEIARALENRAQRVRKYYQDTDIWNRADFLKQRLALEKARDVYATPFFGTTLAASTEEVPASSNEGRSGARWAASKALREFVGLMRRPYDQMAIETGGSDHEGAADGSWKWETGAGNTLRLRYKYRQAGNRSLDISSALPTLGFPKDLLGWGILALLVAAPFPLILLMARKLFLLDVDPPEPLKKTGLDPDEAITSNSLVLGEPGSGKTEQLKRREDTYTVNVAKVALEGSWAKVPKEVRKSGRDIVALDHFEFKMDDAECSRAELTLLEDLLYTQKRTVVIVSAVDPSFYFARGGSGNGGKDKGGQSSLQEVDRWAGVLCSFQKLNFRQKINGEFEEAAGELERKLEGAPAREKLVRLFRRECGATGRLQAMGKEVAETIDEGTTKEQLVTKIQIRADAYYRALWAMCSKSEKLALIQLAQDGLVNPKSREPLDELSRKGLIEWKAKPRPNPRIRIMNESFKRFVISAAHPEEVARWEAEGARAGWGPVRAVFFTFAISLGVFLFVTQRDFLQSGIALMTGLAALIPALLKVLGFIQAGGSETAAGS
jgi:hypothetical protein